MEFISLKNIITPHNSSNLLDIGHEEFIGEQIEQE